jgi:predicted aspartyl protease
MFAALAAACVVCTPLHADESVLSAAIEAHSVLALEAWTRLGGTPDELGLAKGAALALRHKDEAALAILTQLSTSTPAKTIRAGACRAMADVYVRQGRFADAHAAFQRAQDVSPLTGEARQALGYTAILAGEKPMKLARPVSGTLDVRRDSEGLIRVPVGINGTQRDAVIDTDASFSVLSESQARRLGVRVLEGAATIVTSTQPDLPMHLGVADTLTFGDAVFSNVVFAVLPDAAVRFSHGYKMDVVVGLPVFLALERIELAKEDGREKLAYGAAQGAAAVEPNLIVSGFDPFVLVNAGNGAILRLALDTAASNTMLNATVLKDYPWLGEWAVRSGTRVEGGGGAMVDMKAQKFRNWKFEIAGKSVTLKQVSVLSADEGDRHGMLGQDALKKGWVLDFRAMTFTIDD